MKLKSGEDGQAFVLIALLMVVLMGFAALGVDVGSAYFTKEQLQNAADAAALAGAKDLSNPTIAEGTAVIYAGKNHMKATVNNIAELGDKVSAKAGYGGDLNKIEVVCSRTVKYSFAGALGFKQTDVSARAVASRVGSSSGISGLRPWVLQNTYNYTYGLEFDLKQGGGGGSNGYYGIVSFGDQGGDANTYKGNITDGYDGTVKIGDIVNDANGNKNVKKVINDLMTQSGDYDGDYTKAQNGNSRVVLVAKIDSSSLKVIGFSAIYLKSVDNKGEITANFLYDTTWSPADQAGHNDWGLNSKVKLTE